MRACDAGIDVMDTAISPLSGGTGQPATESMVMALRDTPFDTGYDVDRLLECRKYFLGIWDKYREYHREQAMKVDPSVAMHQDPGGMLSNFILQLEELGAANRYYDVLKEVPRVQRDFGWPPLVTPTSQIVGVQATFNVVFGRYKRVTNQTKEYLRGMYGRPPSAISEDIRSTVLGEDWQDQIVDCRPADLVEPMFQKCREEMEAKGLAVEEEQVLSSPCSPPKRNPSSRAGTGKSSWPGTGTDGVAGPLLPPRHR